jgi:hypothetical protein
VGSAASEASAASEEWVESGASAASEEWAAWAPRFAISSTTAECSESDE